MTVQINSTQKHEKRHQTALKQDFAEEPCPN